MASLDVRTDWVTMYYFMSTAGKDGQYRMQEGREQVRRAYNMYTSLAMLLAMVYNHLRFQSQRWNITYR